MESFQVPSLLLDHILCTVYCVWPLGNISIQQPCHQPGLDPIYASAFVVGKKEKRKKGRKEKKEERRKKKERNKEKKKEKVLRSAVSNLMNKENAKVEPEELYVKEAYVNQGPTLKRISPAPMGRAYRIRKRSCHLTIVVATKA